MTECQQQFRSAISVDNILSPMLHTMHPGFGSALIQTPSCSDDASSSGSCIMTSVSSDCPDGSFMSRLAALGARPEVAESAGIGIVAASSRMPC